MLVFKKDKKHLKIINAFIDMGKTMSIKVDYIYNNYNLQINVYTENKDELEHFKNLGFNFGNCNYYSTNYEGYYFFIFSITIVKGVKTLYHVTKSENVNSILEKGLTLSDSKNFPNKRYKRSVFFGSHVIDILVKMEYNSSLKYTVFKVDLKGIKLYVDGAFDDFVLSDDDFLSVLSKTSISKDRIVDYFEVDYIKSVEDNKEQFLIDLENQYGDTISKNDIFDFLHIVEGCPKTLHVKNKDYYYVLTYMPYNNKFYFKTFYKRAYSKIKENFDGIKIYF